MVRAETIAARRAERRQKLIRAGIDQMGAGDDYQRMTLRSVLSATKLTERYFYESFAGFSAFVVEVYEAVGAQVIGHLVQAGELTNSTPPPAGVRAAIHAFVGLCDSDPALIRTLLVSPLREPELSMRGVELSDQFARLAENTLNISSPDVRHLTAVGNIGALTWTSIAYLRSDREFSRVTFVDYCCELAGVNN
ncbi:TetR/AcrR family transcriptional regulator [Gordonia sp. MP11Mi]|uniref:TetR family transcriptional regulator n=1 Tax=Gordonia sp. MP11Mi TaxID=3022769 RepID=A0AA97GY03_9ACTN